MRRLLWPFNTILIILILKNDKLNCVNNYEERRIKYYGHSVFVMASGAKRSNGRDF